MVKPSRHSVLQHLSSGRIKITGKRKEATEWHRIVTSNRLAEIAKVYLKKGGKSVYRRLTIYKEAERQ
jgi:single-stranded DNA-binding protein